MKATHPKKGSQPADVAPTPASRHGMKLDWAILLYPASILAALALLYVVNRSIEQEPLVPLDHRGSIQQTASTSDGSSSSASATGAGSAMSVEPTRIPDGTASVVARDGAAPGIAPAATAGGVRTIDLDGLEGSARIAAMLRNAVVQNDQAMIKQCLEELVAMGDDAVASLVDMVNGQDETGLWAAEALARIGTPSATVALLDTRGQTEEGQFKEDLAGRVAGITNHESWPVLLDAMLQTEDASVARAAGDSLARMADTPVMDEIIARYEAATSEAEIGRLAQLVSNIQSPAATTSLLSLAGGVSDAVQDCLQQAAIDALSNIGDAQCVSYLLRRLEATAPGEGTSFYNAITQIDSQEGYAQLLYAAAGNKEVSAEYGQTAAIEALANYPCEQTSALLERLVAEGSNEKVVTAASRTLDTIQKRPYAVTASAESLDKSAQMLPIASTSK